MDCLSLSCFPFTLGLVHPSVLCLGVPRTPTGAPSTRVRGLPASEAGVGLSQAPHGAALPSRGGAKGRVLRPGGLQLWPVSASAHPGAVQRDAHPILLCPWLLSGGTNLEAGSFLPCVCWDRPCRLTADTSLLGTLDPGLDPDPWCSQSRPWLSLGEWGSGPL